MSYSIITYKYVGLTCGFENFIYFFGWTDYDGGSLFILALVLLVVWIEMINVDTCVSCDLSILYLQMAEWIWFQEGLNKHQIDCLKVMSILALC